MPKIGHVYNLIDIRNYRITEISRSTGPIVTSFAIFIVSFKVFHSISTFVSPARKTFRRPILTLLISFETLVLYPSQNFP